MSKYIVAIFIIAWCFFLVSFEYKNNVLYTENSKVEFKYVIGDLLCIGSFKANVVEARRDRSKYPSYLFVTDLGERLVFRQDKLHKCDNSKSRAYEEDVAPCK